MNPTPDTPMLYGYHLLRSEGRHAGPLIDTVRSDSGGLFGSASVWGVFTGLFGLASNEVIVMVSGDRPALDSATSSLGALSGATLTTSHLFEPTVRPTDHTPLDRDGIFVFRFFGAAHADADEIARLSDAAWTTFATSDDYRSEPMALFREHDPDSVDGSMLLVTWYDGFASWETSRAPAPEATENFRKRRLLTTGTIAYPTRLARG